MILKANSSFIKNRRLSSFFTICYQIYSNSKEVGSNSVLIYKFNPSSYLQVNVDKYYSNFQVYTDLYVCVGV